MTKLTDLSIGELRRISVENKLQWKNKVDLSPIFQYLDALEEWRGYKFIYQLGHEGKDGRTFMVCKKHNQEHLIYALKLFRESKANTKLESEIQLQQLAADNGIAPSIIESSVKDKFIVMNKLDCTLYECFKKQKGQLNLTQQKAVVRLFKKLDACELLHNDPNPLNFMRKGRRWYIIDYGLSKRINASVRRDFGSQPNVLSMTMGLMLQLRTLYSGAKLEYFEQIIKTKKS